MPRERHDKVVDLRADYHGHVIDFASEEDRRWFERHPEVTRRQRPEVPHEHCLHPSVPDGACAMLFGEVTVIRHEFGRVRIADGPLLLIEPVAGGRPARLPEVATLPSELAEKLIGGES